MDGHFYAQSIFGKMHYSFLLNPGLGSKKLDKEHHENL
jgi:hypothetical protein